jgi:biopolymer transport protein ExbB/biopolymer transport protein TolQ
MGPLAKAVVIGLFIMSAYSIGVMIDRLMAYSAARKQSRQFAPAVAGALREGKLDEAVKIADRFKKSHLAKVVVAGLQEFQAHQIVITFIGIGELICGGPGSGSPASAEFQGDIR